jgi:hypothetical protein
MTEEPPDETRLSTVPVDRLTRICDAMTKTFDLHREMREGDKCQIFIEDAVTGGIVLHGYDDEYEALVALLIHLRAIFRANGQDLELIAIPEDASGLDQA